MCDGANVRVVLLTFVVFFVGMACGMLAMALQWRVWDRHNRHG